MRVIGSLQGRVRVVVLTFALATVACRPATVQAPQPVTRVPQLVPAPASITAGGGTPFNLVSTSSIIVDAGNPEAAAIGEMLAELLRPPTGFPVTVSTGSSGPGAIVLRLSGAPATVGGEGYQLSITSDSIRLVANRPAGLFHGIQTIRQLLPVQIESEMGVDRNSWQIPAQTIADWPRFAWRGAMLDVARHFFTVREVEQYIDLLALYKMNVLHLHLSDDQGWRIAIASHPELTAQGAVTQVG